MDRHRAIDDFLRRCHSVLDGITADRPPDAPERRGAEALLAAIDRATAREYRATSVAVLDTLDRLSGPAPAAGLIERFTTVAPHLPWTPTHRADDGGTELALAPLDRALDLGSTVVGLMYVGPGATYPLHQHPPQELYLTIAGTGRWRYGGADGHRTVEPLHALYNHPGDLHSATAGDDPLLALYVLW